MKMIWYYMLAATLTFANGETRNLMPVPEQVKFTNESHVLAEEFRVVLEGAVTVPLQSGADRFLTRLAGRTGIFFTQPQAVRDGTGAKAGLIIRVERPGRLELGEDESYQLSVNSGGITLTAVTDFGAMHGMETILQLLTVSGGDYVISGVEIHDRPRFPWRGLMIDASRHFMPVDVVKRNLNVMHWHLSDDQGFRVESQVFPALQEKASDGFYYTQEQVKDVIAFAANLGIRVLPEFDVPGHATAMVAAYPELGSGPVPESPERKWGIFYQALNPASEYTYQFLDKLFGEMSRLFPDKYFHIGGDELEHGQEHQAEHWNNNNEIQAFMKKKGIASNSALQAWFNARLLESLTRHGKIMVGWDEILHENMPTNIVIQSWRGRESMEYATRKGYQSLLSNGYYIDLIYPASDHYLNDPLPADIDLTAAEQQLILGGETTMWAEYVSPETVDSRIWPRTAAIAERFWSPREVTDLDDMYRRLETVSYQLEEHGLLHIKNYEMMLRRLTGNRDTGPLRTLIDVIEPLKHYQRGSKRPYDQFSPLTRVVDAARPDARVARNFNARVDAYLAGDKSQTGQLKNDLIRWKTNHEKLLPLIAQSPVLKEVESLSADLSAVAAIGLAALESREAQGGLAAGNSEQNRAQFEQARVSRGQTEIIILPGLMKLAGINGFSE